MLITHAKVPIYLFFSLSFSFIHSLSPSFLTHFQFSSLYYFLLHTRNSHIQISTQSNCTGTAADPLLRRLDCSACAGARAEAPVWIQTDVCARAPGGGRAVLFSQLGSGSSAYWCYYSLDFKSTKYSFPHTTSYTYTQIYICFLLKFIFSSKLHPYNVSK